MTEYPTAPATPTYPAGGLPPVSTGSGAHESGGAGGNDGADQSMKDRVNESAQAGKQAAGEVAQTAAEKAKDVAQEGKQQARDLFGQAKGQLEEQAGAQHRNAVTNLRSLGDELHSMARNSDGSGYASDLAQQAGDRVHATASWLDDREPGQLLDEVRDFARRKPGTFLLGALAAGVVAGRLTRGVVAAHQDDDSSAGSVSSSGSSSDSSSDSALNASYEPRTDFGSPSAGVGEPVSGTPDDATVVMPQTAPVPPTPGYSMPPGDASPRHGGPDLGGTGYGQ